MFCFFLPLSRRKVLQNKTFSVRKQVFGTTAILLQTSKNHAGRCQTRDFRYFVMSSPAPSSSFLRSLLRDDSTLLTSRQVSEAISFVDMLRYRYVHRRKSLLLKLGCADDSLLTKWGCTFSKNTRNSSLTCAVLKWRRPRMMSEKPRSQRRRRLLSPRRVHFAVPIPASCDTR